MSKFSISISNCSPRARSPEEMYKKHAIKVIKNGKRKVLAIPPQVEAPTGPGRWSTQVQSWVSEFQKQRRDDSLPAFNSLFK